MRARCAVRRMGSIRPKCAAASRRESLRSVARLLSGAKCRHANPEPGRYLRRADRPGARHRSRAGLSSRPAHSLRDSPRRIPVAGVAGRTSAHYLQRRPHADPSRRGRTGGPPSRCGCAVCCPCPRGSPVHGRHRLVNPRFEVSYWGLEHALPLSASGPIYRPLACHCRGPTPAEHTVTLIDENVEAIDFDRLARADIVGVTGMSVQRRRIREILRTEAARSIHRGRRPLGYGEGRRLRRPGRRDLHRRSRRDLAPVLARLDQALISGATSRTEKTDMTRVPVPAVRLA